MDEALLNETKDFIDDYIEDILISTILMEGGL